MNASRGLIGAVAVLAMGFGSGAEAQEVTARRGWLGFAYEAVEAEGTQQVRIESVYPRSPAAAAGVRNGDQIIRWNGSSDVGAALEALRLQPGDTVRLRIRRDDERDRDITIVAGQRPANLARTGDEEIRVFGMSPEQRQRWQEELRKNQEEIARIFGEGARMGAFQADSVARLWGERFRIDSLAVHADSLHKGIRLMLRDSLGPQLQALNDQLRLLVPDGPSRTVITLGSRGVAGAEFEEMNPGLSRYFGTDEGALVLRVSPGTPAARAGLQPGDVVLQAAGREVDSVDDIRSAVARAQGTRSRAVQLEILREGRRREVDLRWE